MGGESAERDGGEVDRVADLVDDDHAWTLHWADRNGRWHVYDDIEPATVDELLAEIARDPTGIVWG